MNYYQIHDRNYFVEASGAGDPVVLLHGFTGSSTNWRSVADRLSEEYRILAIDQIGHGRSSAPAETEPYTMPQVAADLGTLLALIGALPAHWLGYSMGGRLALYIAVNHPSWVRSLILESASPGLKGAAERAARRREDEALADRIEANGIETFVAGWEKLPLFDSQAQLPADIRASLRSTRLANSARGLANSLRGMGTGAQPSLWERLSQIDRPTLLISGELDTKFMVINQQMAAAIPDATQRIITGSGHAVHLERSDEYSKSVLDFLRDRSHDGSDDLPQAEEGYKDQ